MPKLPDRKTLISLYYKMLRIRLIEEKIAEAYPEEEMRCPVHLSIGQEAVAVGVCAHLKKEDCVLSNHRAHGHYLAKGGDLVSFLGEIYGKNIGCSKGRGGSMHLVDLAAGFLGSTPIVASTIPIATGVAFAEKMNKRKNVTVSFLGDAAVEECVFHESVNFAALKKLPILYVCENNLYSVYTHLKERQPKREIFSLVKGHGIMSFKEDGNDVLSVYEATQKALKAIRAGKGPVFVEFSTYRWREHCGPNYDNDLGYRTKSEFEQWKKLCPVERFKKILLSRKILTENQLKNFRDEITEEIQKAFEIVKAAAFPEGEVTPQDAYAK